MAKSHGEAMKVLIFGATGMVGQGVLRECLQAPDVELTVALGRTPTGITKPGFREIVHRDLWSYAAIEASLAGLDACFFCLGVASNGRSKMEYERITYDLTMAAAKTLSRLNPEMTFIYVSGSGTDSTEHGWMRWAQVKGRTENALLRLPFKAYMFRPGFIEPMDGIQSKTPLYRVFYSLGKPLFPLLRRWLPNQVVSTRDMGQAMLAVARNGYEKRILETRDIRAVLES
jgi:uncharacterized protein YbjT (DUF2867 family)